MVRLTSVPNPGEAHQIVSMLRAHGVEAFVPDDTMANIAPHHLVYQGGVEIRVQEGDLAKAQDLLKNSGAAGPEE